MDSVDIDDDVVMKDSLTLSSNTASSPSELFTKKTDHEISDDTENSADDNKSENDDDDVTMTDEPPSSSSSILASLSTSYEAESNNDSGNDNIQSSTTLASASKQVVDVPKLLDLLSESASASSLIDSKDVLLLVGLTGAGKFYIYLFNFRLLEKFRRFPCRFVSYRQNS